jgi:hypothetical protein
MQDGPGAPRGCLYVFTNLDPHKGIITCSDSSSSSFNADPSTLVKLHPGFTAKSLMHMAMAPMDISQMVPSIIAMWPEDLIKLLIQQAILNSH